MTPEERKPSEAEEHVEDLDVNDSEAEEVKAGRKAGGKQQEYLKVELVDIQISSY